MSLKSNGCILLNLKNGMFAINFSAGSIVVDYRVSWTDDDALSEELLENSLKTYVKENYGYIYSYFVPVESLTFSKQEDSCAMQVSEMK